MVDSPSGPRLPVLTVNIREVQATSRSQSTRAGPYVQCYNSSHTQTRPPTKPCCSRESPDLRVHVLRTAGCDARWITRRDRTLDVPGTCDCVVGYIVDVPRSSSIKP